MYTCTLCTCTHNQYMYSTCTVHVQYMYIRTLKSLSMVSNVFECSGNCALISSDPMNMLSR